MDSAVESSGKVPKEFKQQMNNWIHDLVQLFNQRMEQCARYDFKHYIWKEQLKGYEPVDYIPV